jgi:hypothetical protein
MRKLNASSNIRESLVNELQSKAKVKLRSNIDLDSNNNVERLMP